MSRSWQEFYCCDWSLPMVSINASHVTTYRVINLNVFLQPVTDVQHIFSYNLQPLHTFIYNLNNLPGKSISINWQYAAPVHSSSILVKFDAKQSLTHANISCRLRLSVVTFVEYTLTAAMIKTENIKYTHTKESEVIYIHNLNMEST